MKINGLIVDTQAIADGLYEIICERDEEAIVAFGMIPKWIIDLAEQAIREKIIAENAKRLNLNFEELKPYVDEKLLTFVPLFNAGEQLLQMFWICHVSVLCIIRFSSNVVFEIRLVVLDGAIAHQNFSDLTGKANRDGLILAKFAVVLV
jgi:hypothetical protein